VNPFNQTRQSISFSKTRLFVFWNKNPTPLVSKLPTFDRFCSQYYFQFTVNDYECEGLEPNIPSLAARIKCFRELSNIVGPERVIWRFDPLILACNLTVPLLVERIERVGDQIADRTRKLIFSYADIVKYPKVRQNLQREHIAFSEFKISEMEEIAERVASLCKGWNIQAATCAESLDLSRFGIQANKCIDDELIAKLYSQDQQLMAFLGWKPAEEKQRSLFDSPCDFSQYLPAVRYNLKDKGQRKDCGCIVSKDIGRYNTCSHLCKYCYANTSKTAVIRELSHFPIDTE
jgi:DNA repair photolyase